MITVPFLNLSVPEDERHELLAAVDAVLRHGRIMMGPEVEELEVQVAAYIGANHAIGVGSGTDALILALRALGIGPGDEVITTPLSFIATANAIRLNGATPVFADIDDDLQLAPESIAPLITPATRAILPVHWAGRVCRMDAIMELAERHGLKVIEDTSQAFGAARGTKKAGTWGVLGTYSMNSMKTFAALGEAGMILTDDKALAERLATLRYNGLVNRELCLYPSHNGRIDTVQAAMLKVRLRRYEGVLAARRRNAEFYDRHLRGLVLTPRRDEAMTEVHYTYQIQTERRDALQSFLLARGIETKIQHAPLMPRQPAYSDCRGHFPNAERLIARTLCLPIGSNVTLAHCQSVVTAIRDFFEARP